MPMCHDVTRIGIFPFEHATRAIRHAVGRSKINMLGWSREPRDHADPAPRRFSIDPTASATPRCRVRVAGGTVDL